jgi:hypothetical protein
MKRITVDEILDAYGETGLQPTVGEFIGHLAYGDMCACAIGAFAAARLGVKGAMQSALTPWAVPWPGIGLEYSREYIAGFIRGFDADEEKESSMTFPGREERMAGYEDGRAAARAVFGDARP